MKRTFGYVRVSSTEQHLDRQIDAIKQYGVEEREIVSDKMSGKNLDRPGYQALKNAMLRQGDTLIIKSLDRLSRNKTDIKDELEYYKTHNIRVKVIDLHTTMIDLPEGQTWVFEMINNILIEVLSSIAEHERLEIRQRQSEGVVAAKKKGVHLGRPKAEYPANWESVCREWRSGNITARVAMEMLGLKRTAFYKLVSQYENA